MRRHMKLTLCKIDRPPLFVKTYDSIPEGNLILTYFFLT